MSVHGNIVSSGSVKTLFSPIRVGPLALSHRVVMAPFTRLRSQIPGDVPVGLMAEYYGQRASEGGLIISEGATVSIGGRGYLGAPGIYSEEQIAGWRSVTEAVHAKGGYIFLQLWHVGRVSHVNMTNCEMPVAPSVVPFEGIVVTRDGFVPPSPHRALEIEEIPKLVDEFRKAAWNAKAAGFDGVEIHGANGYILDQFLQDGTNKRTDIYGGPIENRARLLFEVLDVTTTVWGEDRVGVRLSPNSTYNSMFDSHPEATFGYVANRLNRTPSPIFTSLSLASRELKQWVKVNFQLHPPCYDKSIKGTSSPQVVLIPKAPKPSSREMVPIWSPSAVISSPIPICQDVFNLGCRLTTTTEKRFITTMHEAIPTTRSTTSNSSTSRLLSWHTRGEEHSKRQIPRYW